MKRRGILILALFLLVSCGGGPVPTPDLVTPQVAVEKTAFATLTTELLLPTDMTTPTRTATPTASSTLMPTPTSPPTPSSTSTPSPTSTPVPTSTSAPTPSRTPIASPTLTPTVILTLPSGITDTPPPPFPLISKLSGRIAFTVWNTTSQRYDLYASQIDGSERSLLGEGFRQPQFQRGGDWLVVNGDRSGGFESLVIMKPDGTSKRGVSDHADDHHPSWCPDLRRIVYASTAWGDGRARLGLSLVHQNTVVTRWVSTDNTQIQGEVPFCMSNGRVVYHGCDWLTGNGRCGLYWVDDSWGGNYHLLTNHHTDTAPAESKGRVAFMSARDGNWEVYLANQEGSGLQRLTDNNARDGLPTWSPDGAFIAFVSDRSGTWAIWGMEANGSNQHKLFDLSSYYGSGEYDWTTERISWSP